MKAVCTAALVLAAVAQASFAGAQPYPSRPITLVVPFPAGGPTDALARILAQRMSASLGQQLIIENVGGAAGTVGAARVARAGPDGYTLLIHNISHATAPAFYKSLPYNPAADFEPIGLVAEVPQALVSRPNLQVGGLKEMVGYLKSNSAKLNIANAGPGSGSHLCALMLFDSIGTKLTEVAYKGTGPAITDLMGGTVDVMCDQISNTGAQIKAGTIKGYCVAAKAKVDILAELPLCSEALPGFSASVWHGFYAPKDTPAAIVASLGEALKAALADPDVKQRLAKLGATPEPASRVTPAALKSHLNEEMAKWARIIGALGTKTQ